MKKCIQPVVLSFFILFLSATFAAADSLLLQPGPEEGTDASWYTFWGDPNNYNFGHEGYFEMVTYPDSWQGRGLLKFALPDELAGASIQGATLSLYGWAVVGSTLEIRRATSYWEELPAGSVFTPPAYDSLYQTSAAVPPYSYTWVDYDLTDMVGFWVSNPGQNYGMVMESASSHNYAATSDYGDASLRPKLSIDYTKNVVPEPLSMALFALGGLAMVLRRRKR